MSARKSFTTTLDEETSDKLRELSYLEKRDRNLIIEDAIKLYVEEKKTEEAPKKPKK